MTLANCKIIDGKHNTSKRKLVLTVDFLEGQPKVGECIYLKEQYFSVHFYEIEKVDKSLLSKHHELTIKFKEPKWMWNDRIRKHIVEADDTAICGISVESFYNLTSFQKLDYIKKIAKFIAPDKVGNFINDNLKFATKFITKEKEGGIGLTKFGGLPYCPSDISFPKDINGKSALFICQVHLAEVNQWFETTKEFKEKGVLYFFASIKSEDEIQVFNDIIVLYSNNIDNLKELNLPDDLKDFGVFEQMNLMVAEEINLPPSETSLWQFEQMTNEERNKYWYVEAIINRINVFSSSKILGHPSQIQGCVLLEAELKSTKKGWYDPNGFDNDNFKELVKEVEPKAIKWRHLFDIDPLDEYFRKLSGYDKEFNQYMDGRFYVMIKQEDLDAMNFKNIETVYQCT
jgi:uncharacterized protein YwqG